jgi:sulfite reductase (ferredoxin)
VSTDLKHTTRPPRAAGRSRPPRRESRPWALDDHSPSNADDPNADETWNTSEEGRAAAREPHEMDDEHSTLHVRIDGGAVDLPQLQVLAGISTQYARGTANITDRQDIHYRWIRVEDVPEIWTRLEAVGLRTAEPPDDVPQAILGSPVAGVAADEILDGTPAILEIQRRYVDDPSLAGLPREIRTAISGSPHQDVAYETHDIAFVGIDHPEYGPGFDLWIGGLSTDPGLARRLNAFVPLEDVTEVWFGVIRVFRDYGHQRLHNRARLKFLVADWEVEEFRDVLETEYLGRKMQDSAPLPPPPLGRRDHMGVHRQRRGRFYVGAAPVVSRVGGEALHGLARLVERAGSNRIRLAPEQRIVILDVRAPRLADLVNDLEEIGLTSVQAPDPDKSAG